MRIAVDFDGTIVEQEHPYDDLATPLSFKPGARDALLALRRAGHWLLLWSGRATQALLDPTPVNVGRHQQMLLFVAANLPGVFDDVDDGRSGKPSVDLFVDDRAIRLGDDLGGMSWRRFGAEFGTPHPRTPTVPHRTWPGMYRGWEVLRRREDLAIHSLTNATSREIDPIAVEVPEGYRDVVIVAGQHGDEVSGVLALWEGAEVLIDAARGTGARLILVPCANPEGYVRGQRYNAADQTPTNSFLEYLVQPPDPRDPPRWVGELPPGTVALSRRESMTGARETRALHRFLRRFGLRPGYAVLDLHEDSIVPAGGAFAYVFGDRAPYAAAMAASGAVPLANTVLKNDSWTDLPTKLATDADGLVEFYDGSLSDWAWRDGASWSACLECSTKDQSGVEIALRWALAAIAWRPTDVDHHLERRMARWGAVSYGVPPMK